MSGPNYTLPEGSPAWFQRKMQTIMASKAPGSDSAIRAAEALIERTLFLHGFEPGLEIYRQIIGSELPGKPSDVSTAAEAVHRAYVNSPDYEDHGDPA
jgi:hypothetical protein